MRSSYAAPTPFQRGTRRFGARDRTNLEVEEMAYLNRYDPFREALSLRDAMDRLFQESYVRPTAAAGRNGWVPMDVEETGDAYRMHVQLPGWKPEDVNVTVQESTVTISGQHSAAERKDEDNRTWHVRERNFASFNRTFS